MDLLESVYFRKISCGTSRTFEGKGLPTQVEEFRGISRVNAFGQKLVSSLSIIEMCAAVSQCRLRRINGTPQLIN